MSSLLKLSTFIAKLCQVIGGVSILLIVLVTMSDVVTRYIFKLTSGEFGFTIKGSVELVSYLMLFALLSAFAAYVERSQIIVDVFTQKMGQTLKAYMMGTFMLGFCVLGLIFTLGLYDNAIDAANFGKVTQDLRISMTPIYGFSAFLSLLLAIRAFIESIQIFRTGEFYDAEETGA